MRVAHAVPRGACAGERAAIARALAWALTVVSALPAGAQESDTHPRQALTHHVQVRVPAVSGILSSSPRVHVVGAKRPGSGAYGSVAVRVASNVPSELRIRLDMPPGMRAPEVTAALHGAERALVTGSAWTALPGVLAPGVGELVVTVHASDPATGARDLAAVRLAFDLVPSTAPHPVRAMHHIAERPPAALSTRP